MAPHALIWREREVDYYRQNYVHGNTTDLDLSPGGLEVFFNSSEP